MAPIPDPPMLICLPGKEEANAQRDDHEEIACKAVAVGEGSRNGGDAAGIVQIEDMAVAAKEFEDSVEGFEDPHQEDRNNEVMHPPISVMREPPAEEKKEKARKGQPLEELDLGGKGEKT